MNFGYGMWRGFYPDTEKTTADWQMPNAMKALEKYRKDFSFICSLDHPNGTGAHWGGTTFLTGADVSRTPGRAFHNDISCDQVAARYIGQDVRFPTLTISGSDASGMGPGMSLAWDGEGNPIYGEKDHTVLFNEMFGESSLSLDERRHLLKRERSILDVVRHDAKAMNAQLGAEDRQKVEQYFGMIREIEKKLARNEQWMNRPKPKAPLDAPASPLTGTAEILTTFDLMTAALQTDSTRVITYRMPTSVLLREFQELTGIHVGAHQMSHAGPGTDRLKAAVWRAEKLFELFGAFIERLKTTKDVNGAPLLDNTMVVMGSGLRAGHGRRNVPILLAGGTAGGARHGKHYVFEEGEARLSNLWLSMLNYAGCPVKSFSDSTGPITQIFR